MYKIMPALILLTGLLYIFIIPAEPHAVKLIFKAIPMILIIAYAYLQSAGNGKRFQRILLAGLVFCIIGDVTLDHFIVGLSAFLIGHLFYLSGFFSQWKFSVWRAATILPIGVYAVYMGNELLDALAKSGDGSLKGPVLVYVTAISLMGWSAMMSGNVWAVAGALLFMASDSVLAWNKFVSEVAGSDILIMTTYYAAQFCIAACIGHQSRNAPKQKAMIL
ncbi:lysoplasmalogenase [Paenibacillus glycanilyticus]|uniref:lysoplasmalogenase n=1 Tax=Paenibacillus glycanilyticus TaxID=126569 RepID=UPI002040F731|nr:lysoplasmalogenase [Paenibacillus glycanilyticus]MCM3627890.1 lysoplasmalogenase [Paenibacillus glycanilyticus]